jgi:hypothetical protein
MSLALLRSDIIKAISRVEDENLLAEIRLLIDYYAPSSGKMVALKNILGPVDFEELKSQLNEPEEEYSWDEVKKKLKSFS